MNLSKFDMNSGLLALSHRSDDQPFKMSYIDSFG